MISPRIKLAAGVFFVMAVVAWMGLSGLKAGKSYYVKTDELVEMKDAAFDKRFRVAGIVQSGSVRREEGRLHFEIGLNDAVIPVVYVGRKPVPDTFKDGVEAVVEGEYTREKVFQADHIQAKCASKYEADYEEQEAKRPVARG